ncbi:hypothetical protein [Burkholderia ubonensis]|uniref:hypothetical protein n=1 Tax=Burkholderia ubonensis TaxID=101571 RepID=UPI000AC0A24D|nr:hypothetical protein [Burkholderia ubonensis]
MLVGNGTAANHINYSSGNINAENKAKDPIKDDRDQVASIMRDGSYNESLTPSENFSHAIENGDLVNDWDTLTLSNISLKLPAGTRLPENIELRGCNVEYELSVCYAGESAAAVDGDVELEAPSAKPLVSVSEAEVSSLFDKDKVLFHALNDETIDALVDNRRPTYCGNLASSLHGNGVKALSTTALVKGVQVDTYRGTGIVINSEKTTPHLIAKGDANAGTDSGGVVTGQRDCETIQELCDYVRKTPLAERNGMNEVKCDFGREAVVGFAFRASVADTPDARRHENNAAYLKLSLLQKYFKDELNIDCKIYTYEHKKGVLQIIQKESERKWVALNIVKQSSGDAAATQMKERLNW